MRRVWAPTPASVALTSVALTSVAQTDATTALAHECAAAIIVAPSI